MATREEIRKRMRPYTTSCSYCGSNNCPFEGNPSCANCDLNLDQALQYLHSQGVVIKVNGGLPPSPYVDNCLEDIGFNHCRNQIKEAGYVAVEPLIEEN